MVAMARRLGVGVAVLASVLHGDALADGSAAEIVHLRVERAVVRPLKGDGRYWDGLHESDLPKKANDKVQSEVARIVKKQLLRAGVKASLAAPAAALALYAAKRLYEWSSPPDPFGDLTVGGRVVAALPLAQDRLDPSWPSHGARYVRLLPGAAVELRLLDADLSGAHDPIGTCSFDVGDVSEGSRRTITSKRCTGDLLAASVVAERAPAPAAVQPGRYRVAAIRAGVKATKPDGRQWDLAGFGDPQIQVNVGGQRFDCPVNHGQRAATCAPESLTFDLTDKTTIAVRVVEVDALLNDPVGTASVGDLVAKESRAPITMTSTDSIAWAEVVIEPADSAAATPP